MLYIVSASYDSEVNGIRLKLYNTETQKLEEWIDTDFKPYYLSRIKEPQMRGIIRQEIVEKYDALRDESVSLWKVYVDNPLRVKKTHDDIDKYRENHIRFTQCYIYDNDIKMGMPYFRDGLTGKLKFAVDEDAEERIQNILDLITDMPFEESAIYERWVELLEYPAPRPKRIAMDIEVYSENKNQIPDSSSAILPILTICFSNERKIALVLIQDKESLDIPQNIDEVTFFSDEGEMIESAFKIMNEYPFLITFNGDNFDLKYLYNRARRLNIPKDKIPIIVKRNFCTLKHSIHIDLYRFFSIKAIRIYSFKAKYKTEDLDTIGKALIKKGKLGHNKSPQQMNYCDLIKYCMRDAEITYELTTFDSDLVMNLIFLLMRLSLMSMEDVSRKSVSNWVRSIMLSEHRRRNFLIPTSEELKRRGETVSIAKIKGKKYKGGLVIEPVSGTHFKVVVLDFASLYPSIFKIYNIGYSAMNCSHPDCKAHTIGELPHWICEKNRALESILIGSLRDLRVAWYKPKAKDKTDEASSWYSAAEQSIKVIMNASYGVFGSESFAFYCPPVAEEITSIARFIILQTINHAREIGIHVIYGDTDSIFIKEPTEEKLKELITWTENKFGIDFEVEKTYKYICMSGRKKNYLGVESDGTVDVKGLTGKKKHTPPIIKNIFNKTKKILGEVETPDELEKSKREIVDLIKDAYKTLKLRKWKSIEDLAFNVTMTKELSKYQKTTPQHIKVAKMLIESGYKIDSGYNIRFIKIRRRVKKKKGYVFEGDVKPVELTKNEEVDVEKYIEFLRSTFKQVLEPMNINFEQDIMGIQKIEKWFN